MYLEVVLESFVTNKSIKVYTGVERKNVELLDFLTIGIAIGLY